MFAAKKRTPKRYLMIDDLLACGIAVDGVCLEAKVDVVINWFPTGGMEVDSLDVGDVYIQMQTPEGFDDLIKVDKVNFEARHARLFDRFCDECERLALKRAQETPEHKWSEWEEGW